MALTLGTKQALAVALKSKIAAAELSDQVDALAGISAAELGFLDGVTAGTVTAGKALVADSNKDIATLRALTLERFNYTPVARTATADGLTTGTIADAGMLQFVSVTSASANNIIVLPTPTVGTIVVLYVGANGYELRSNAPASVAINGGSGADAESAIAANQMAVVICTSSTSWHGFEITGATLTAIEAAA